MLNDWGKNDKEVLDESLVILKKEIQNMQDLTEKLLFLAKSKNLVVEKKICKFRHYFKRNNR